MASKAKQFDALWSGILDDEGLPVALGKVYTYIAGSSSTTKATYTDRDKNTTAANPIILDAYGRAEVYGDGIYNIIVKDANDVTLWDMDNVEIIAQSANLILDGDELTSQSVNGNIDIQPTGIGVIRVGGTNNGTGDAQITTIQINKDIDIAPNGTGKVYLNKNDSGSTGINIFIDEDTFASDRADAVPTQQSVKAYVASQVSATSGKQNINSGYFPSDGNEFKVTIQSPVAMAVDINASGYTWYNATNNAVYNVTANPTLTITAADPTSPRWDIVQINAQTQAINVKAGTAATIPTKPTADSGYDIIAYIFVNAAATTIANQVFIRNIASAVSVKVGDNHFKTNFSINQKEDTEDTEYEMQQRFEQVSFGTTFDYVRQDKTFLHTVDTYMCRADNADEITYTGSWSNSDSASFKFGRAKTSTSASAKAVFSFFGVSVGVSMQADTNKGYITAELSSDGGTTWTNKILLSVDSGSAVYNNQFDLYTGLPIGEYKVRINLEVTRVDIEFFYYTTYVIQKPVSLFAMKSGSGGTAAAITSVPPATCFFTGTWTVKNDNYTDVWNSTEFYSATDGDYVEFKFYGSKIWINIMQDTNCDIDLDFTIDGVTTYVRNPSGFNPDTPNNAVSFWYRIDNGSLPEGVHVVRATRTTGTAGTERFYPAGFSFYSANAPSTICRSLITGADSFAVGPDDSNLSYSGTWVGLADDITSFMRRRNVTVTQNSYVSYTTPNNANLKAIYLVGKIDNSTIGAEVKVSLGGASSNLRYVDTQSNDYEQSSIIWLLYDSFIDKIDLHNLELRIVHNDTTTTTSFAFEGLIFEMGDPVSTSFIKAMPKWTRFNQSSASAKTQVSNTQRLDVYGIKSDLSPGRLPVIHSGWEYLAYNSNGWFSVGVMMSYIANMWISVGSNNPMTNQSTTYDMQDASYLYGTNPYYPGIILKNNGSTAASTWHKLWAVLKEVV